MLAQYTGHNGHSGGPPAPRRLRSACRPWGRPLSLGLAFGAALGASAAMSSEAHAQRASDPHPDTTYVAVVVGMSVYQNLPDEVELDFGRSDAASVASAFSEGGAFDYVFLLADSNATKASVVETMREKASQFTGPNDVLVFYFVGHGIGADFGLPTLLVFDSTIENGHQDGLPVDSFATDINTWTRAGRTLIVTDAIHKNQLDGIYFYGASAEQWTNLGPNTMVISSSQTQQPAEDGKFGIAFADAISGAADVDADKKVTFAELRSYLTERFATASHQPAFAGSGSEELVFAQGVTPGRTLNGGTPSQSMVYGDHDIYAAKFVFRDGSSPTVTCRDEPTVPCDNICYVRNFKTGPCKLSAFVDGKQVEGTTLAVVPGKYECYLRAGDRLSCLSPQIPQVERPAQK